MDKKEFSMKNVAKFFGKQNRWVCVIFLALVCTGAVFAQKSGATKSAAPSEKENAIALDVFHLMRGFIATDSDTDSSFFVIAATYERLVAPHFTVGPELDLIFGKIYDESAMYFALGINSRFYPMTEKMEKFFFGASLGFNRQAIKGKTKKENGGFIGPYVALRAGYKLTLGETVFYEPSMSYTYSKTNEFLHGMAPHNIGWQGALRLGFSF